MYDSKNNLPDFLKQLLQEKYPPTPPTSYLPFPIRLPTPKDLKSPLSKKWHPLFLSSIKHKLDREEKMGPKKIRDIQKGLTMPDVEQVVIGSAKKMVASVMFFDLMDFTLLSAELGSENTLFVLNLILPQMMQIVKHWNGEIEKNTGDGIMAIFGTETRNNFLIARDTIEAAMTIRYVMGNEVNSRLGKKGIPSFGFRIGIDMEELLIARVGMQGTNFLTVVGSAANRASKLQNYATPNGICIGENLYGNLHPKLYGYCEQGSHKDWNLIYEGTRRPYRFFHFNANWPDPKEWVKAKF
jgi:adenylate cyclase